MIYMKWNNEYDIYIRLQKCQNKTEVCLNTLDTNTLRLDTLENVIWDIITIHVNSES